MLVIGGAPVLSNCRFWGNSANDGGGMANQEDAETSLEDCEFENNEAVEFGGGMYNTLASSPSVSGGDFSENLAHSGGAISSENSSMLISGSTFSNNQSVFGGAIENISSSSMTIQSCTFSSNESESLGGAVLNESDSLLTITDSIFSSNTAADSGGALAYMVGASLTVNDTQFINNSSEFSGGALYLTSSGSVTIENSVLFGNATGQIGGGLGAFSCSATIVNTTFSSNLGETDGGAIYANEASEIVLTNAILWGNDVDELDGPGDFTITYSNIEGSGATGTLGNIDSDPMFANQITGDLTLTCEDPPADCSPCVDTGDDGAAPEQDILGNDRVDIEDVGGINLSDMGAYELVLP
jgi:predicted outer membrane repeat protein